MMKQRTHVAKNFDFKVLISIHTNMGKLILSCPDFSVLSNLDSLAGNGENIRRGRKRYNRWAPLGSPDSLRCFRPFPPLQSLVSGYSSPIPISLRLRVSFSAHKLWDGVFVKPLFFLIDWGRRKVGRNPYAYTYMRWDTNWHKLFSDL